jgi:hypothetical protein
MKLCLFRFMALLCLGAMPALAQTNNQRSTMFSNTNAKKPIIFEMPVQPTLLRNITQYGLSEFNSPLGTCTNEIRNDFDKLTSAIVPGCWDAKKNYDDVPAPKLTEKELIESDYQICNCLNDPRQNPSADIRHLMKLPTVQLPNYRPSKNVVEIFEKNAKRIKEKMEKDRTSLAFQASIISEGNTSFTQLYAADPTANQFTSKKLKDSVENNAKDVTGSSAILPSASTQKENDEIVSGVRKVLEGLKVPPKTDPALFQDEKLVDGQCVPGRDFLAYQALPQQELLKDISETTEATFDPKDWNYDELKKSYDEFMRLNLDSKIRTKELIVNLKAKLRFLDQNPMIKTFFAVDPTSEYLKNTDDVPQERKQFVLQSLKENSPKIDPRKKQLFGILKKFSSNQALPQLKPYLEDLRNFFVQPDVANLMDIQAEKELYKKLNKIGDFKSFTEKTSLITQQSVENDFVKLTKLGQPSKCGPRADRNIKECVEIYAAYCKTLEDVVNRIRSEEGDPEIRDDLDVLAANDFEPSYKTNNEFKKFNDNLCQAPRRKANDSTPVKYEAFKASYCKNTEHREDCKGDPKGMRNILTSFLKEYPEDVKTASSLSAKDAAKFAAISKVAEKNVELDSNRPASGSRRASKRLESLASLRNEWGVKDTSESFPSSDSRVANGVATASAAASISDRNPSENDESPAANSSYAPGTPAPFNSTSGPSNFAGSFANSQTDESAENMSDEKRREELNQLKEEYDELAKSKKSLNKSVSEAASSQEAALKARIDALEQLLAGQKKLLDNQSLASQSASNKNINKNKTVAEDEDQEQDSERRVAKTALASGASATQDSRRAPASVRESQVSASSTKAASASANATSARRSVLSAAPSSSSDDSVAREEAKLVNLRSQGGFITIESVGKGASSSANAISYPVSDEQYKLLQSNPMGLNLTQIEKNIPKDQIENLERNGEIILLLRNGSNPPFEVKVEKKNKKLVYRLRDESGKEIAPVKRVYTRKALEGELQAKSQR